MTKTQLINAIAKLQGADANREFLKTKSIPQLREMLARWKAIAGVNKDEINRHCNTDFIK